MNATDLRSELERSHVASFGWALSCCRQQREEAEDVLHTAYMKVLGGQARFEGRSSFRTWFFGVIRHTASEQRRRRWVREILLQKWFSGQASPSTGQPNPLEASQESRQLRDALQRLPDRQRQVLHLVFYQDFTVEEAAGAMGVSLGTARTHFARGKSRLRQILSASLKSDLSSTEVS